MRRNQTPVICAGREALVALTCWFLVLVAVFATIVSLSPPSSEASVASSSSVESVVEGLKRGASGRTGPETDREIDDGGGNGGTSASASADHIQAITEGTRPWNPGPPFKGSGDPEFCPRRQEFGTESEPSTVWRPLGADRRGEEGSWGWIAGSYLVNRTRWDDGGTPPVDLVARRLSDLEQVDDPTGLTAMAWAWTVLVTMDLFDPVEILKKEGSTWEEGTAARLENHATPWLDLDMLYGRDPEGSAERRRGTSGGRLRRDAWAMIRSIRDDARPCMTDEERWVVGALLDMWTREHNRIADATARAQPHSTDEELFQRAREITLAEYQAVTYNEWLVATVGGRQDIYAHCHDPSLDPRPSPRWLSLAWSEQTTMEPRLFVLRTDEATTRGGSPVGAWSMDVSRPEFYVDDRERRLRVAEVMGWWHEASRRKGVLAPVSSEECGDTSCQANDLPLALLTFAYASRSDCRLQHHQRAAFERRLAWHRTWDPSFRAMAETAHGTTRDDGSRLYPCNAELTDPHTGRPLDPTLLASDTAESEVLGWCYEDEGIPIPVDQWVMTMCRSLECHGAVPATHQPPDSGAWGPLSKSVWLDQLVRVRDSDPYFYLSNPRLISLRDGLHGTSLKDVLVRTTVTPWEGRPTRLNLFLGVRTLLLNS